MFWVTENRLTLYIILLIFSVAGCTYLLSIDIFLYTIPLFITSILSIKGLISEYQKFNRNVLLILEAIENGDNSIEFFESKKISKDKRDLNRVLNRIKQMLSDAKENTIKNEKFLSLVVESMPVGIAVLDGDHVVSANKACLQLFGINVFTHLNQLRPIRKELPSIIDNLIIGKPSQIKIMNEKEEIQINLYLSKIKLMDRVLRVIVLNNIENELEAKEIESWIRLIRVMTHEIMNSIAPIISITDTLLSTNKIENETIIDDTTIQALEIINSTGKNLTSFVDSYRKFSGVPQPRCSNFLIKPLIENVILLNTPFLKEKGLKIEFLPIDSDLELNADKEQISQVLLNLIKNAIDAIDNNNRILIKVNDFDKDSPLEISVMNDGKPISQDIASNIFIPFFTTKEEGTGIGLSISKYIMRLHGGNLKYAQKQNWTVFSLIFNKPSQVN